MHKRPYKLVVAVILAAAVFSIYYWASRETPTELLPGFWSLASEESVRERIASHAVTAEGGQEGSVHTSALIVQGFEHLGQSGELQLEFVNRRLMAVRFFPDNMPAYLRRLSTTVDLLRGSSIRVSKHTWAFTGTDLKQRRFVCWADRKMLDQLRDSTWR